MDDDGHGRGRRDAGPPSSRSRGELSDALRRELADARLRLQEASLRVEAHRMLGDPESAAAALREQQQLLGELRQRLDRSVSAAIVQRDAEDVLAAVEEVPAAEPAAARRRPVLSGVASLVALLAVASMAVLGRGPGAVDVLDAADGADRQAATPTDAPSGDAPTDVTASDRPTGATPEGATAGPASESAGARDDARATPGVTTGAVDPGPDVAVPDLVTRLQDVVEDLAPLELPVPAPSLPPADELTGIEPGDARRAVPGGDATPTTPVTTEDPPGQDTTGQVGPPPLPEADDPVDGSAPVAPPVDADADTTTGGFVPDTAAQ